MAPSSSKPSDILSQFKVRTITHKKMPDPPENEFLVIETVDQSNKTYLFILQRTVSSAGVTLGPVDEPGPPYRIRPVEKIRKFIATLATSIAAPHESHLASESKEGRPSSSSSSSSPSVASESLLIDGATMSLVQTPDLMSDPLDKSENSPAIDQFLGQNYVYSAQWHGKIVRYFKPDHLTLFELVLLTNVVHEMHPTSSILGEQCYFYVRLVYTALETYFGISPPISADESKDNIDSHIPILYGRWEGPMVNKIEEETLSKVLIAYEAAYSQQVARVYFVYLFMMIQTHMTIDTDHKNGKLERASGEIGTYQKYYQRGIAVLRVQNNYSSTVVMNAFIFEKLGSCGKKTSVNDHLPGST
jgi:hypothetical protein